MRSLYLIALLLASPVYAEDVSLREYLENRIDEQDRRVAQAQLATRDSIQTALLAEIRRQDEARNARYALKEEVAVLSGRVMELEGSQVNTYVGILVVALIGVANLVKGFWGGK